VCNQLSSKKWAITSTEDTIEHMQSLIEYSD